MSTKIDNNRININDQGDQVISDLIEENLKWYLKHFMKRKSKVN